MEMMAGKVGPLLRQLPCLPLARGLPGGPGAGAPGRALLHFAALLAANQLLPELQLSPLKWVINIGDLRMQMDLGI